VEALEGLGDGQVGIIEGIAEATASIVKVFSGAISDWPSVGLGRVVACHAEAKRLRSLSHLTIEVKSFS
jgi:hypothetical protein